MKKLISIEDQIIKETIRLFLHDGFRLSVYDGEETVISKSRLPLKIFEAMKSTDEDYLFVSPHFEGELVGWVRFVYGNEGVEVICDYTTNLEPWMEVITKLIDEYEK